MKHYFYYFNVVALTYLFVCIFLGSDLIAAEEMNVPADELAQESVLPRFDSSLPIKNRNIQDSHTFDVGLFGGLAITEPIASISKYGFAVNYYFNQYHLLGLLLASNSTGLSKDAESLKNDFGLDFTRVPFPKSSFFFDYNYKLYYGKLSFTRSGVMNTSIYFSSMLGAIQYVHKSYPAIAIGVGERFYFTDHFALKIDLRIFANTAPIAFKSGALRSGIDPVPSYDSFSERMTTTTSLEAGLNYLF